MEFEDREHSELCDEARALEAAEAAAGVAIESPIGVASDRWPKIAAVMFGTLIAAAGVLLFHWMRWMAPPGSGSACESRTEASYLVCYGSFGGFLMGPALFIGATVAACVEGLRGRRYYRWLLLAGALLAAPIVARVLEVWVLASR